MPVSDSQQSMHPAGVEWAAEDEEDLVDKDIGLLDPSVYMDMNEDPATWLYVIPGSDSADLAPPLEWVKEKCFNNSPAMKASSMALVAMIDILAAGIGSFVRETGGGDATLLNGYPDPNGSIRGDIHLPQGGVTGGRLRRRTYSGEGPDASTDFHYNHPHSRNGSNNDLTVLQVEAEIQERYGRRGSYQGSSLQSSRESLANNVGGIVTPREEDLDPLIYPAPLRGVSSGGGSREGIDKPPVDKEFVVYNTAPPRERRRSQQFSGGGSSDNLEAGFRRKPQKGSKDAPQGVRSGSVTRTRSKDPSPPAKGHAPRSSSTDRRNLGDVINRVSSRDGIYPTSAGGSQRGSHEELAGILSSDAPIPTTPTNSTDPKRVQNTTVTKDPIHKPQLVQVDQAREKPRPTASRHPPTSSRTGGGVPRYSTASSSQPPPGGVRRSMVTQSSGASARSVSPPRRSVALPRTSQAQPRATNNNSTAVGARTSRAAAGGANGTSSIPQPEGSNGSRVVRRIPIKR